MKRNTNKQSEDLHFQLTVARKVFFKAWDLIPAYKIVVILLGVIMLLGLVYLAVHAWNTTAIKETSWGALLTFIALPIITLLVPMFNWLNPSSKFSILIKFSMAVLGYALAKIHLYLVDRFFLARGELNKLLRL